VGEGVDAEARRDALLDVPLEGRLRSEEVEEGEMVAEGEEVA